MINSQNMLEHPAVTAWMEVQPESRVPQRVELIEESDSSQMAVRLFGIGLGESNIIAKRSLPDITRIERLLYEEILPNLSLPTVHYYGTAHEKESELSWLFLEDVSGERYQPNNTEHRIAAAKWLGSMNTYTEHLAKSAQLPLRDTDHYMKLLRNSRKKIQSFRSNPGIDADKIQLLNVMETHYEDLDRIWEQFRVICNGNPNTLVHGDFISKNVAVRIIENRITILPFDWEKAGWGSPAEDISRVDIPTYWNRVQGSWPELSIGALNRLAAVGKVFRCAVYLDWISTQLEERTIEQSMYHLQRCKIWLTDLINSSPWQN
ncbi:MAG: phosphotransferase [Chloroflexota bacterium]|nr:MAG: phosphotransferase [Chloroflexota bacterium]